MNSRCRLTIVGAKRRSRSRSRAAVAARAQTARRLDAQPGNSRQRRARSPRAKYNARSAEHVVLQVASIEMGTHLKSERKAAAAAPAAASPVIVVAPAAQPELSPSTAAPGDEKSALDALASAASAAGVADLQSPLSPASEQYLEAKGAVSPPERLTSEADFDQNGVSFVDMDGRRNDLNDERVSSCRERCCFFARFFSPCVRMSALLKCCQDAC